MLAGANAAGPADPVPAAVADDPGEPVADCQTLFTADDPRLFDFIHTRDLIDFSAYRGRTIGALTFVTLPIFNERDPRENNAVYRFLNRTHILTKTGPIRRQLLFRAGQPLDDKIIYESERILRGDNFLYDAMVLPGEVCADRIDLLIVVRDIWTLQPTVSFKRQGGDNSSALGFSDENLLGQGHTLAAAYTRNAERSGVRASYANTHLFDGHTELRLTHQSNDDGKVHAVSLDRPFYAVDTRWAAGAEWYDETRRDRIESAGVTTNDYAHDLSHLTVYGGRSRGLREHRAGRWRFGITRDQEDFYDQDPLYTEPLPAHRVLAYPWLEYESVQDDFWNTTNYNQLFRNEDIELGTYWRLRTGATSTGLGSTESAFIVEAEHARTESFGANHLLKSRWALELFHDHDAGRAENTFYGYEASYQNFLDERNRWYAALHYDGGINLDKDNELTLGGENLLRGYPSSWQRGDQRIAVNVERRHYFSAHVLNLVRLGAAGFVDVGKAWDSHDRVVQSDQVLANVGIGLRVNSSKARPNHVVHFDLAAPLVDRRDAGDFQWSIYSEQKF